MGDEFGTRSKRNWSVGLVLLLGAAGCATSGPETDRSASNVPAGPEERTQQAVQRMMPADGTAAHGTVAHGTVRAGSAVSGSEGLAPPVSSREGRSTRRADAISSKHLEAELNRLEAELGR